QCGRMAGSGCYRQAVRPAHPAPFSLNEPDVEDFPVTRGSVLVMGGGIGGLATAIAIRNAHYDVRVVEIHPNLHSSIYGVGIIQPMTAMRALDVIGCADACLEIGFAAEGWAVKLDVDGNKLYDIPGISLPGDKKFPPMNGVTRPQLHEILTNK